jgi:hypothetical protein
MLLGLGMAGVAHGQEVSAALRDRVAQLVEKLGAKEAADRDAAEKALIALGARALPALPEEGKAADEDARERLKRVREALAAPAEGLSTEPTRVTLDAKGMRLSEVLRELQKQTGNRITDLRDSYGQEATNPALDLKLDAVPFLQALDQVAEQAGLTPTFFTGDGTVGLTAGGMYMEGEEGESQAEPIRQYAGPFRIVLKQYATQTDFASGTSSANAQMEIDWEPRLRPMLLSLAAGDVEIADDQGRKVEPRVTDESGTVVLRPENPAAEMNLNMSPPERSAQKIGTLKVKANITVPSKNQIFRFPKLTEKGAALEQGPVTMKLLGTEVDEFVWKVDVEVAYGDQGEGEGAFETYRQGLFNNRIWLQRADGSRFEHNGGFNQTGESGTTLRFQYLFVDAPGNPADYQLVYETPTSIESIPVEFTFKDIPLP